MKNKIEDLRNHLFAQLERLGDDAVVAGDGLERELSRARAMSDVAKTLIDSARVEVDFMKVKAQASTSANLGSAFIESTPALPLPAPKT